MNTITRFNAPSAKSVFMREIPGMATMRQKQIIRDLVSSHIEDSETSELYLNQLDDINETEANIVIKSFGDAMW